MRKHSIDIELPRPKDWRDESACRTADPELFFPVGTGPEAVEQAQEAKTFCFGCPVMTQCLNWALDNKLDDGIWGGLDEVQRHQLKLRRRATRRRRAAAQASRAA